MSANYKIPYVTYNEMREFYTLKETCELLNIDKDLLKETCDEFGFKPIENEIGDFGLPKYCVRKVHNHLYRKFYDKGQSRKVDPWA